MRGDFVVMDLVHSPSSLKTYVQCPYKYKAMYITKEVKWQQSEAAARGEQLHKLMENAVMTGWDDKAWKDTQSYQHAYKFWYNTLQLQKAGWTVHVEEGIGIDDTGTIPLTFWDRSGKNYLRCRIDFYATHPQKDIVIIFDWKTGKKYDVDKLQLQANAMCLRALTGKEKYVMSFCYLDSGDITAEQIDLTGVKLNERTVQACANSPCMELLIALNGVAASQRNNQYFFTPNRFCKWCQVESCPNKHKVTL